MLYIRIIKYLFTLLCYVLLFFLFANVYADYQVKCIYFLPNDRTLQRNVLDKLGTEMLKIQSFYADEMERYGHGEITFDLTPIIYNKVNLSIVFGLHDDEYYSTSTFDKIYHEVSTHYDLHSDIYVVFLDTHSELVGGYCGFGQFDGGMVLVPATGVCVENEQGAMIIAHELGHAFNLVHDFRDDQYMMSYGQYRTQISECAAATLSISKYFTGDTHTQNTPATIQILNPLTYTSKVSDLQLNFKVSDPDGIYQIQFVLDVLAGEPSGMQACQQYENTLSTDVVFSMPNGATDASFNTISLRVYDTNGYVHTATWTLQAVDSTTMNVNDNDSVSLLFVSGNQPIPNEYGLNPKNDRSEWTHYRNSELKENRTADGNPLIIGGQRFDRGLCVVPGNNHVKAILVYDLTGQEYTLFEAYLGIADEQDINIGNNIKGCTLGGSVIFSFNIDGNNVYTSPLITGQAAEAMKVSFTIPIDAKELTISVDPIENTNWCDAAVIGEPQLYIGSMTTDRTDDTEPVSEHIYADVNGDGVVNLVDLVIVASRYGETITGYPSPNPDVNRDGIVDVNDLILVTQEMPPVNSSPEAQPDHSLLLPNYPNPFNPETWIPFYLSKPTDVVITIYNIQGREVRTMNLGYRNAGMYINRSRAAYWDGKTDFGESVASGVYFYSLTTDSNVKTRRMLIQR